MISDIKPYLRKRDDGTFLVGAEALRPDDPSPYSDYHGPCAEVSADDDWVHVCTDNYEGSAMLNVEALPFLIKALKALLAKRRAEGKA